MNKISIITAVHNGIVFNKLYEYYLQKYTRHPYELIIIDNISTDGSREFFKQQGAIVIENEKNYSFPYCQNQGIKVATGDYLFFLNNDIIVSPGWDKKLIDIAKLHGVDIISAKGVENMGDKVLDKKFDHAWKRVKNPLTVFGFGKRNLQLMHRLMYGNWEKFCTSQYEKYGTEIVEGILGNNVMMTRNAINKVGLYDEQIQSADFDLYIRTKKRSVEVGDIKPCQVALGVYIHHYIRLTSKYAIKPVPFADADNLIKLTDKWTAREIDLYSIKKNK